MAYSPCIEDQDPADVDDIYLSLSFPLFSHSLSLSYSHLTYLCEISLYNLVYGRVKRKQIEKSKTLYPHHPLKRR